MIGANSYYDGESKRINDGHATSIKFDGNGSLVFRTAEDGDAGSPITTWQNMVFTHEGRLGVGTLSPQYILDVRGENQVDAHIHSQNANKSTIWVSNNVHSYGLGVDESGEGHLYGNISGSNLMSFTTDGKVLVGDDTDTPGTHKLYVNGSILATEVNVAEVANWPDYVFEKDYSLPALHDVETFIDQNGHLPGVPSQKEVKENGINLAGTDAILLKKIEELTLYLIDQQKRAQQQQEEIDALKEIIKMR